MFILSFNTGASNQFVFDNVQDAKTAFASFLKEFLDPEDYARSQTWDWLEVFDGTAYAWVPPGFYWGEEFGSAWTLKEDFGPLENVSINEIEYNLMKLYSS